MACILLVTREEVRRQDSFVGQQVVQYLVTSQDLLRLGSDSHRVIWTMWTMSMSKYSNREGLWRSLGQLASPEVTPGGDMLPLVGHASRSFDATPDTAFLEAPRRKEIIGEGLYY